jgi:predicted ArsR family transcriptional regulator
MWRNQLAQTVDSAKVLAWMRSGPATDSYTLDELSRHFGVTRERMRDHMRRLVDAGLLTQSEPIPGFADANPSYALPKESA